MVRAFDTIIRTFCWSTMIGMVVAMLVSCSTFMVPFDSPADTNVSLPDADSPSSAFDDGGTIPILDLPFLTPYTSLCTQGVNGAASHHTSSTMYDIDFDTSNTAQEPLYAPVAGTVYVHTEDKTKNFGFHLNIDQGNGTYVILGHLSAFTVVSGQMVVAGQMIGYEGCTGYCSGDHVHVGLHVGDASKMGQYGVSTPVRYRVTDKTVHGSEEILGSAQLVCGIAALGDKHNGHKYISSLQPFYGPINPSSFNGTSQPSSTPPQNTDSSSSAQHQETQTNPTGSTSPADDVWVNDLGLDGEQETLMMRSTRWPDAKFYDSDAYVWGKGGCFDGNLTQSDLVHAQNGYYQIDFSKLGKPCLGELTLISTLGTDGNPPNTSMSNWVWWQNTPMCSQGSGFCELQKNGTAWEEWLLRVAWDPYEGLIPFGNGYTKNTQLK